MAQKSQCDATGNDVLSLGGRERVALCF